MKGNVMATNESLLDDIKLTAEETATLRKLRRLIERGAFDHDVFEFTPAVSEALLDEYNNLPDSPNRPKKPANIIRYTADMQRKEWALTGDTVKFSDRGRLVDGQNRLTACCRAGVAFSSLVVFGVVHEYFDRMDRGKPRDASDLLHLHGYPQTARLAAAIRWAFLIDEDRAKARDTLDPRQEVELIRTRYPLLVDMLSPASKVYDVTRQPIGIVAGLLLWFSRANESKAREFIDGWTAGKWGGKFTPIRLLTAEIARLHQVTSGRVHDTVRAALIITAWNLFYAGRKGTKADFQWTLEDDFPAIAGRKR